VLQEPTTDKFYLPSLKVEAALGVGDLTSISSYFYRNEAQLGDDTNFESVIWTGLPYPVLPGQNAPAFIGTAQNVLTQEIRLQSHDRSAPLRWTAGLFYSDAREKDYNYVEDLYLDGLIEQAFGISLQDFFGTGLAGGKYTFVGTTLSYDKQAAAFGQLEYRLWRSLTVTAGLRVARTRFDFVQDFAGPVNYSGSGPASRTITGSEGESPVTPKIGLSYNVTAKDLVYFSAGEGYRIGGANSPVPLNPACKANLAELGLSSSPLEYHSDKTWSYEVGFKGRSFGDRLQVEASAFHIDWNDIQQYVGLPSCGGIGFVANLGNAVSNGFDLQVNARPVPQLLLSASVGYTDATYSQTVGSNGTIIVDKGDTVGTPPVGFSPWTVQGSVQYDLGRLTGHDVYVRVDDTYSSHQSGRSANLDDPQALGYDTELPFDPATNELNVRIGTLVGGADISVFANNILNDHPLLQRTHDIPGSPLYYDLTLRPLTAGVTLSYRY